MEGTEGPERGAEAQSGGAPRGLGLGRGAVANVEIAHFPLVFTSLSGIHG